MGNRARGANAIMAGKISTVGYGGILPATGYLRLPFVSSNLGEEQGLIDSDLLGYGADPDEPADDVVNNEGAVVVPVDLRNFGFWLKLYFGASAAPVAGLPATGGYLFSAQPANNGVLTIAGTAVTFVTGTPTAGQVKIGASLAETIANLVNVLNTSVDAGISAANYAGNLRGNGIVITHKTLGTAGNSFTTVAGSSPATNATASAATLAGGSASGAYTHVFTAGGVDQLDAAIEVGMPEVPRFGMNYGVVGNNMSIQMQRSGLLNATLDLIAQGEDIAQASVAGTLTELAVERFSQFSGSIELDGVQVGKVESATLRIARNQEKDESIRPDGRIGGSDAGKLNIMPEIVVRFADEFLMDKARSRQGVKLTFGWSIGVGKRLTFVMERVRLPRPRVPVTGPNGVRATFSAKAVRNPSLGRTLQAILVNDVESY